MSHSATIVNQFVKAFDPKNQEHVTWLKNIHLSLENMDTVKSDVPTLVGQNPMKVKFTKNDMMDWVHVHFALNFNYTKAVLRGEAWVPPQRSDGDDTPQA